MNDLSKVKIIIEKIEDILTKNDMEIESFNDKIIINYHDKEYVIFDEENAEYGYTLPRVFESEKIRNRHEL